MDEIGDMPLVLQAKVLRFLQDGSFMSVGGQKMQHADVRLICATNSNLTEKIEQGKFRQDLYYRINVIPIALPPLRERDGDIWMLGQYLCNRLSPEDIKFVLTQDGADFLEAYPWPGNIRQLENLIERTIVLYYYGKIQTDYIPLHATHLRESMEAELNTKKKSYSYKEFLENLEDLNLNEARKEFDRALANEAMSRAKGNVSIATKLVGKYRADFYKLLRRHNIDPESYRVDDYNLVNLDLPNLTDSGLRRHMNEAV